MTNQEAAEMIRNDMKLHYNNLSGEYRRALSMAISALQEQELKQELKQEVKNSTESSPTHKTLDTISRQAVYDALDNIKIPRNASWYPYYQQALTAVSKLPSAQPEPLVKESRTLVKDLVEEIETWNRRAGEEE